jgi:hypothetical protein
MLLGFAGSEPEEKAEDFQSDSHTVINNPITVDTSLARICYQQFASKYVMFGCKF